MGVSHQEHGNRQIKFDPKSTLPNVYIPLKIMQVAPENELVSY